ncbi:preprotein translocase subunit SecE [Acidobacteriota bacterium]
MLQRVKQFLDEVKVELKKVTWPGRKEVYGTTTVVIIAVFIFGIFLYICDLVFTFMRKWIFDIFGV